MGVIGAPVSSPSMSWEVWTAVSAVRGEAWRASAETREAAAGCGRALAEEQQRPGAVVRWRRSKGCWVRRRTAEERVRTGAALDEEQTLGRCLCSWRWRAWQLEDAKGALQRGSSPDFLKCTGKCPTCM